MAFQGSVCTATMLLFFLCLSSSASAMQCSAHSDCQADEYCDVNSNCFVCDPFCMEELDAIDGCCPCDASCTPTPPSTVVRSFYQFTFSNDFEGTVDNKPFFMSNLQAFLRPKLADDNLVVLDAYPGSVNVVMETTGAAAFALRQLLRNQSLQFTYVNTNATATVMTEVAHSVLLLPAATVVPTALPNDGGGSSSSDLTPVIAVVVVIIVLLVLVSLYAFKRTRSMNRDLQAARMSSFDETDASLGLVAPRSQLSYLNGNPGGFVYGSGVTKLNPLSGLSASHGVAIAEEEEDEHGNNDDEDVYGENGGYLRISGEKEESNEELA